MPKTTVVSFGVPAIESGEPFYSSSGPACVGSTVTPRFIPQDNADKVARAAAALMLDNKSTFSANSWDTKTTANRSVSTLNTKKSHVELVGRKEQGVVHKAVLNPPEVSDFNRSHLDPTADNKSTRSGGGSKDSKRSKSSTAYGSINSKETTAIVMNRSPPVSSNQLQRSSPSVDSKGSSMKEPSCKGFWSGVKSDMKSTQQMGKTALLRTCNDEEMSYLRN